MPAKEMPKSRSLLQKQFDSTEADLEKLAGKTDDKSVRERRRLKALARKLATRLGSMNPPDKDYP